MKSHPLDQAEFVTPGGSPVRFLTRRGTNDWNVVNSITTADEYELAGLSLDGWALDLGAHIGGVAVCLAVDHPSLYVVAVEPVPYNVVLARRNAELNGAADRVHVVPGAIGTHGETTTVRYAFEGDENAEHHAFIGNSSIVYPDAPDTPHEAAEVVCVDLLSFSSFPPAFVKVDVEGGEWAALEQLVQLRSPHVVGEWHPTGGHTRPELAYAFEQAGYNLTFTGPPGGPGGFTALPGASWTATPRNGAA